MNYMDVKTAASKWELTERRITMLCRDGRIEGAKKESGIWLVPANADKPEDGRSNKVTTIMKNSKKLPMPIGISDFKELVAGYYYVDKTLMIKEFLDTRPKVSLFTRPRRFGKTLAMDMLKTFLKSVIKIPQNILKTKKFGIAEKNIARSKVNTPLSL